MDYPIWDVVFGGGVLIGLVAIPHVIVSHFAIGAGIAMAILETLAVRNADAALRSLCRRGATMLILVSTVFGAISGVGIWVTIGLVQPTATSLLIHEFVWGWAAEWAFFILEIATALAWAATWDKVSPKTHLKLIWLYAAAAWGSLAVIQGIISFMLTPGRWTETGAIADGFFNPTYWPGVLLRTGICLLLAGAWLLFAAVREPDREARGRLVRWLMVLEGVGVLAAYHGFRWWEAALPDRVRALYLGASPTIVSLGTTRRIVMWGLTISLALAALAWLRPRLASWPVALVALLVAAGSFGAWERLREGVRKPFVIRDVMFSNGLRVDEVAALNRDGILAKARWATIAANRRTVPAGEAIFRAECSICHTQDGYLSIRRLGAGNDRDTWMMLLGMMRDDGAAWTAKPPGEPIYPQMPPFVGTDAELAELAGWLAERTSAPPKVATLEVSR